jgi:hypothetical protein
MDRNTLFAAVAVAAACFSLSTKAQDTVEQPGDPARWYQPADTAQKKFATLKKEAGAALKEARDECRRMSAQGVDRKSCEQEAVAQYQADMQAARAWLTGDALASSLR